MGSLEKMHTGDARLSRGPTTYDFTTGAPLWTVSQVSAALRVSRMTIYRMVHSGELDHVRLGRAYRIPDAEVGRILHRRDTAPLGTDPA